VTLRDADGLLRGRVDQAAAELPLTPADQAAVKIAQQYADAIDAAHGTGIDENIAWALRHLGPLLMTVLCELGATPAARARVRKPGAPDAGQSALAKLRAARA